MPEEWRVGEGEKPAEELVRWGGVLAHVDRYPNPEAPAKLVVLHGGGGSNRAACGAVPDLRGRGSRLELEGPRTAEPETPTARCRGHRRDAYTKSRSIRNTRRRRA
ncbi:hypothetical protein GBA65_07560 [Rubrobacter marinus]|uniref:Uncharacterized protein n=1 Tax=Rubrobacter marinus TaxID=2653852 RepID=A0A6G8PW22_9ACTN|nr:hypothetical protein [Rubrobacter marinus]QIN78404.1 hypothetical protein GBA65_07560 [Rubrobacter marinus]